MGVVYLYASRTMRPMGREVPIMPNRVRQLRKERSLTQARLAEMCGTTHVTIGRIERGEQDLGSYWTLTIARVLGVHPGQLFSPLPFEEQPEIAEAMRLVRMLPEEDRRNWLRTGHALAATAGGDAAEIAA